MLETKKTLDQVKQLYCLETKGEKEKWVVFEYNEQYAISTYGRVFDMERNYMVIMYSDNSNTRGEDTIHFKVFNKSGNIAKRRLNKEIGKTFLGLNNENYMTIYIDGDPSNCFYKNLIFKSKRNTVSFDIIENDKKENDQLDNYLDSMISFYREQEKDYMYL